MSGEPITPLVQMRQCRGCPDRFPAPHGGPQPPGFCTPECHARFKRAEAPPAKPRARLVTRAPSKPVRRSFTPASPEQRATGPQPCLVDASHEGKTQPMHVIPRGLLAEGQDDPRAIVWGCPTCHDAYDNGELDLLPYLEPRFRVELAFAVERFGLVSTLRRVTNERLP